MTIKHDPSKLLKKIAPPNKLEKLVTGKLTLNRAALAIFNDVDFLSKRDLTTVALKTVKQYQRRYKNERESGTPAAEAKDLTINDKKLIVNRMQNAIVAQIAQEIKDEYAGERYKWLPSDADTPDPEHQLNYGKTFVIGDGEMPGDRMGCRCAMEILVKADKLEL